MGGGDFFVALVVQTLFVVCFGGGRGGLSLLFFWKIGCSMHKLLFLEILPCTNFFGLVPTNNVVLGALDS